MEGKTMMRVSLAALAVLVATGAMAQTAPKPASGPAPALPVVAEVTPDFNGDGIADRAVMVNDDGDVHLRLYFGTKGQPGANATVLAIEKREIAMAGGMAGTEPSLEVNARGSLLVKTQNISVGRNRWERTLTIVHRGGRFVVGGLEYMHYDTIDHSQSGRCDFNLLSGKGQRNGKAVSGLKLIALKDFDEEMVYRLCP
jgi:hypothetical protein